MLRFPTCKDFIKFSAVLFFATLFNLLCPLVRADVVPNALFSTGVVLQQGIRLPIWGKASPEEKISVSLLNQTISTKADSRGKWRVDFKPLRAGGPYQLSISGKNLIKLNQVFVGEVYLCGGQSNMEFPLAFSTGGEQAIKTSSDPLLHLFTVSHNLSSDPVASPTGQWIAANPETSAKFSAVAYYFGCSLRKIRSCHSNYRFYGGRWNRAQLSWREDGHTSCVEYQPRAIYKHPRKSLRRRSCGGFDFYDCVSAGSHYSRRQHRSDSRFFDRSQNDQSDQISLSQALSKTGNVTA